MSGSSFPGFAMAPMVTVASTTPALLRLFFSASTISYRHRFKPVISRRHSFFHCSAGQSEPREAPPPLKIAVTGFTELLRFLSPKNRRDDGEANEGSLACSVDDVIQILREDYARAYFITGNFNSKIYNEDCLFEDPTIKFRGKDQYSQNLDLLVPFFEYPSLVLQKIEKGCNSGCECIIAEWKLR